MLGKLTNLANMARAKVTDAVSDVDLSSVKGRISSTVDAAKDMAGSVGDRLTHPADAYDQAINDVLYVCASENLNVSAIEILKANNPFR